MSRGEEIARFAAAVTLFILGALIVYPFVWVWLTLQRLDDV